MFTGYFDPELESSATEPSCSHPSIKWIKRMTLDFASVIKHCFNYTTDMPIYADIFIKFKNYVKIYVAYIFLSS